MNIITIGISEIAVTGAPGVLVSYGLGSCVAIALYDAEKRIGALAHPLLPEPAGKNNIMAKSSKYVSHAVDLMVEELAERGCATGRLVAKLVGGAVMFDSPYNRYREAIGQRNLEAAVSALARHAIPIVAQDTGDDYGRTLEFYTETGTIVVKAVQQPVRNI